MDTKSITIETDKIVATLYFVLIFSFFSITLLQNDFISTMLTPLLGELPEPSFAYEIINFLIEDPRPLQVIVFVLLSILAIVVIRSIYKTFKKARTVAIYLLAINNQHSEELSVKNILSAIEHSRWELAESWSHDYTKKLDAKKWPFSYKWIN